MSQPFVNPDTVDAALSARVVSRAGCAREARALPNLVSAFMESVREMYRCAGCGVPGSECVEGVSAVYP
eukprot:365060-Chlamydomonas_euryale.AAC.4